MITKHSQYLGLRILQNLVPLPRLRNAPLVEHHDPAAERQRFQHVVRHQHYRGSLLLSQPSDVRYELRLQYEVERRERFIEKEKGRMRGQCTGQRHALLLAAGERTRQPICQCFELPMFRCRRG